MNGKRCRLRGGSCDRASYAAVDPDRGKQVMSSSSLSHFVATHVDVPASSAFAFLADPIRLGHWVLGCMRTRATDEPGVYTGFSLFDDSQSWLSIDAHPDLGLIDYKVGPKGALIHRISARVIARPNA